VKSCLLDRGRDGRDGRVVDTAGQRVLQTRILQPIKETQSPDFDNPPIPPTPPTPKRLLFIEYNVVKCFRCIIKNIKEYKSFKKTRFHFMGGLWEG
jgi:hypothetical protein